MKKQNKIYLLIGFIVLILIGLVLVFLGDNGKDDKDIVKVGVILPMTGSQTSNGEDYLKAIKLAEEEINNSRNFKNKISLFPQDGKGDGAESVTAAHNLIGINGVDVILTAFQGPTNAIAPLAHENKVVVVGNTGTNRNRLFGKEYFFPMGVDLISGGEYFGGELENRCSSLAMLYENIPPALDITNSIKEKHHNIVLDQSFDYGSKDFGTNVVKLKNSQADCLFFFAGPESSISLVNTLKKMGVDIDLFATGYTVVPDFIKNADNEIIQGLIYFENRFLPTTNDKPNDYFVNYRERYNEEPTPLGGIAYDMTYVIAEAAQKCGPINSECIKDEIRNIGNYQGVMGDEIITNQGDILPTDYMLRKIEGSNTVIVQ